MWNGRIFIFYSFWLGVVWRQQFKKQWDWHVHRQFFHQFWWIFWSFLYIRIVKIMSNRWFWHILGWETQIWQKQKHPHSHQYSPCHLHYFLQLSSVWNGTFSCFKLLAFSNNDNFSQTKKLLIFNKNQILYYVLRQHFHFLFLIRPNF